MNHTMALNTDWNNIKSFFFSIPIMMVVLFCVFVTVYTFKSRGMGNFPSLNGLIHSITSAIFFWMTVSLRFCGPPGSNPSLISFFPFRRPVYDFLPIFFIAEFIILRFLRLANPLRAAFLVTFFAVRPGPVLTSNMFVKIFFRFDKLALRTFFHNVYYTKGVLFCH